MPVARPSGFSLVGSGPVRLFSTEELLRMPEPSWLVNNVIPAGGLVGLYGPPKSGKSFLAIDLALSIASGVPWQGKASAPGLVVYISAEGTAGLGQRVNAWLLAKQLEARDIDMAWVTESIPIFMDSDQLETLFARFDELQRVPTMVVVDTLARNFDGDENQQEDMGRFIAGVDRFRNECGSSVLVVHHTNSSEGRERGSTAFRGASDTMIAVLPGHGGVNPLAAAKQPKGAFQVSCSAQKESEPFPRGLGRLVPSGKSVYPVINWQALQE